MRLRNNPKAYDIMKENDSFVIIEPEKCKNKWHEVFGNDNPIYIEIGMGKGDFIRCVFQKRESTAIRMLISGRSF